jgi:hypothetical protein
MDALFGHGIFNTNGDEWKFQRKTASQIFNVKNFRDHFTEYASTMTTRCIMLQLFD